MVGNLSRDILECIATIAAHALSDGAVGPDEQASAEDVAKFDERRKGGDNHQRQSAKLTRRGREARQGEGRSDASGLPYKH